MKNPLLTKTHELKCQEVLRAFPELAPKRVSSALALHTYVGTRPQRFFSRRSFQALLISLKEIDHAHSQELVEYLKDHRTSINNAFRHLEEVNAFDWHDRELKGENDHQSLTLIDREVHPAYLRLVEAVFQPLLRIVAHFSRVAAGKGTQGLNLFNVVAELPDSEFVEAKAAYVHLMRNGIAHGGVRFAVNEIIYRDAKGNELTLKERDVVRKFDDLLDTCNGLILAYSVFTLNQSSRSELVPQNLLVDELKVETGTPFWRVTGALPSLIANDQSQLIVYCDVSTVDEAKVRFSAFQTAIQAERAAPGYDRYFVSMKGKNGMPGWASFHGKNLEIHRTSNHKAEAYSDVTQDYVPMFLAGKSLPKILHRIGTLRYSFQAGWPVVVEDYRTRTGTPKIAVRNSSVHRNSWGLVVRADVIVESSNLQIDQNAIRENCRAVVRRARSYAKRSLPWYSLLRFLPLGFAQVAVFRSDYRARRLSNFGLAEDLIGTIRLQRISRIKSPDIIGSTVEYARGCRIAWNQNWLDIQEGRVASSGESK